MNTKFLVISYDPDEQQWFYDVVFARNEDEAKTQLLGIREYATDGDVLSMETLGRLFRNVESCTLRESERWLAELRAEASRE